MQINNGSSDSTLSSGSTPMAGTWRKWRVTLQLESVDNGGQRQQGPVMEQDEDTRVLLGKQDLKVEEKDENYLG